MACSFLILRVFWQKSFQRTSESFFNTNSCSEKHVNFSCLNSLNIANVQISKFCELLLAHALGDALPADVSKQLKAWFDKMDHRRRVRGFSLIDPDSSLQFGSLSIPKLFELKQSGEYTLNVRVRLIQTTNVFAADSQFTTTWLPDVVAKIQIRSGDISK